MNRAYVNVLLLSLTRIVVKSAVQANVGPYEGPPLIGGIPLPTVQVTQESEPKWECWQHAALSIAVRCRDIPIQVLEGSSLRSAQSIVQDDVFSLFAH